MSGNNMNKESSLLELNWSYIIHSEITSLINVMRKNQRWSISTYNSMERSNANISKNQITALSTMGGKKYYENLMNAEDISMDLKLEKNNRLLQELIKLQSRLPYIFDVNELDPFELLYPFLEIIRSGETTGPITGSALSSVEKFIKYEILNIKHPNLYYAISALVTSVTHCKFEATDVTSDEVVLSQILRLLQVTATSKAGKYGLDDKAICEMVEAAFGMCFQARVNELLRRTAEQTLVVLIQVIFTRLNKTIYLDSPALKEMLSVNQKVPDINEKEMLTATTIFKYENHQRVRSSSPITNKVDDTHSKRQVQQNPSEKVFLMDTKSTMEEEPLIENDKIEETFIPFGKPAILETLSVLVSLINPKDKKHTDSMHRVVAIRLLNVVLEVGGNSLKKWIEMADKIESNLNSTTGKSKHHRGPSMQIDPSKEIRMTSAKENMQGFVEEKQFVQITNFNMNEKDENHNQNESNEEVDRSVENQQDSNQTLQQQQSSQQPSQDSENALPSHQETTSTKDNIISIGGDSSSNSSNHGGNDEENHQSQASQSQEEKPTNENNKNDKNDTESADKKVKPMESLENLLTEEESMALTVKDLMLNELCKHLLLLIRMDSLTFASPPSSVIMTLLSSSLRLIIAIFQSFHGHLKHQLEFFILYIMNQIDSGVVVWDLNEYFYDNNNKNGPNGLKEVMASNASINTTDKQSNSNKSLNLTEENEKKNNNMANKISSDLSNYSLLQQKSQRQRNSNWSIVPEVRELFLQGFLQLIQIPTFITDLYVNYDGAISSQNNLFEVFVYFLSKHAFPDCTPGGPVTSSIHQILCLDGLLSFLKGIVNRSCKSSSVPTVEANIKYPSPSVLIENRKKKEILKEGARRFNIKPKQGIEYLQQHNFLPTPVDPHSLALFLKSTTQVSKKLLGEFLAKPDNIDILSEFISLYDYRKKRLDEAIRMMLESFRLPGESQQIERILQIFAKQFYLASNANGDTEIATEDAAFILSYAIVMLNTDQHNPQVRNRMTFNDFKRNVSGINDGKDLSVDYLTKIFNAIHESEIIMPEEHDGELGFNYQWRELIQKTKTDNKFYVCNTSMYDKSMFLTTCNLTIAAITYAFDTAEDDITIQKAIIGLHYCAVIAKKFQMDNVIDSVISSLSVLSGLQNETSEDYNPTVKPKTLDKWSVEFGMNCKGQVAALLMFDIAADYGQNILSGWKSIIECISNLFLHSLLPESLLEYNDFINGKSQISHLITPKPTKKVDSIRRDAGLFSTLFQFALAQSPNDDNLYQPTQEELAAQHFTSECIKSCRIQQIFQNINNLPKTALIELCNALIHCSFKTVKYTSLKEVNKNIQSSINTESLQDQTEFITHKYFSDFLNENEKTSPKSPKSPNSNKHMNEKKSSSNVEFSSAALFFLNYLTLIAIGNGRKVNELWTILYNHDIELLKNASLCPANLIEKAIVSLLKLCMELIELNEKPDYIVSTFNALKDIPANILTDVVEQMMAGINIIIQKYPVYFKNNGLWSNVLEIISTNSTITSSSQYTFEVMLNLINQSIASPETSPVTQENFSDVVDVLIGFIATSSINSNGNEKSTIKSSILKISMGSGNKTPKNHLSIECALKALEKLFSLHSIIPYLINSTGMGSERAWFEFWLPILSGLGQQCYHPCKDVRQSALVYLQRALLSNDLELSSNVIYWSDCFDNVIFPLLEELLKKEVYNLDPNGMDETMARASALMCKIFLHYFLKINSKELERIWTDILQYLCRYILAAKSEFLKEGVIESIKNMLLVMYAQGAFNKPGNDPQQKSSEFNELWNLTWKILSCVLPKLKNELFSDDTFTPVMTSPPVHFESISNEDIKTDSKPNETLLEIKLDVEDTTTENNNVEGKKEESN